MSTKNNYRVSSVSYEAIKLEAAELEIEPGVYLNATGTAEKAPYLLRVIPKEKLELDAFCQAVAKLTGHSFEETRRENDIRMEVIAAAAAEGYTYIDTGYITFDLRIAGSIDSTTAAPTREANPVYLAAYPSRDLAASLAAITAKLSKADAPFKIDTVWGKDSHDRFVTSGGVFQVNGTGFDNPAVMLVFASGTKSPAEVESWKPTYIRATAPDGEDVKTMTLEVTCEAKDGTEVTLEKPNVPFRCAEPVDPTAPRIRNVRDGSDESLIDTVHEGGGIISEGVNLGGVTAYKMRYTMTSGETKTIEYDLEECSKRDTSVGAPPDLAWSGVTELDKSKGGTTIVETPKGTATRHFKII